MTSDSKDVEQRIAERVKKLGRKLTAKELIEVINERDSDEPEELIYEPDENVKHPE